MPLFWKPYTSDVTAFIETLKAKKPSRKLEAMITRSHKNPRPSQM